MLPPPPCTCTLCCDIMLVTDIPFSMVNTVAMGPTLLKSLEEKDKQKKIEIGLKIYVLQCTLYVYRNVHLRFVKFFIQDVLFCSVKYSELCLAGISQKSQPSPSPPPTQEIYRG
jgi:hypothetical protein